MLTLSSYGYFLWANYLEHGNKTSPLASLNIPIGCTMLIANRLDFKGKCKGYRSLRYSQTQGKETDNQKIMLCFISLPLCCILKKLQTLQSFFYILPSITFSKIILFVMSFKQTDELKITRVFWLYTLLRLTKSVIDFICFFVYFKVGRILKHFLLTFGILLRCTPVLFQRNRNL